MTEKVHGSVLVLGGGIAGMQASLGLKKSMDLYWFWEAVSPGCRHHWIWPTPGIWFI